MLLAEELQPWLQWVVSRGTSCWDRDYRLVFLMELSCKLFSDDISQHQSDTASDVLTWLLVYVSWDPRGQQGARCEQLYAVKQRLCLNCSTRAACLQILCSWGPPPCHANPSACPGEHTATAWDAALACLQCELVFPGWLWVWWEQTLLSSSEELGLSRKGGKGNRRIMTLLRSCRIGHRVSCIPMQSIVHLMHSS